MRPQVYVKNSCSSSQGEIRQGPNNCALDSISILATTFLKKREPLRLCDCAAMPACTIIESHERNVSSSSGDGAEGRSDHVDPDLGVRPSGDGRPQRPRRIHRRSRRLPARSIHHQNSAHHVRVNLTSLLSQSENWTLMKHCCTQGSHYRYSDSGIRFWPKNLTFRFLNLESGKPKNRTGKCVPDSSGNGKFSRKPDFPSGLWTLPQPNQKN